MQKIFVKQGDEIIELIDDEWYIHEHEGDEVIFTDKGEEPDRDYPGVAGYEEVRCQACGEVFERSLNA